MTCEAALQQSACIASEDLATLKLNAMRFKGALGAEAVKGAGPTSKSLAGKLVGGGRDKLGQLGALATSEGPYTNSKNTSCSLSPSSLPQAASDDGTEGTATASPISSNSNEASNDSQNRRSCSDVLSSD